MSSRSAAGIWGEENQLAALVRNVGTRYLAILTDAALGLVILPFNVHHLGPTAWGLWMLTASATTYFSILDLGYGGAIVKFAAQYRALRDARALNEILSTTFTLFTVIGAAAYAIFVLVAANVGHIFNITPDQVPVARDLMLMTGAYVALTFPFNVFGGVMNGFQRYDLNNLVGVGSSLVVAVANVIVLWMGYDLVTLVAITTALRIATLFVYRANAYQVFPALSIRLSLFRRSRLKEVTSFSVYIALIDIAQKVNYSVDAMVIGAFMTSGAVAIWTVAQRLAEVLQRLTNQINGVLLPVVVDSDTGRNEQRLRSVFIEGTRLSMVCVVPVAAALMLLARPLIESWVGTNFEASILLTQILVAVIAIRVGTSTATTILKGAGRHALLAYANVAAGVANLVLSLMWIRRYGLVGQAMGTFVPVAFVCVFILWPAACRRVGIGPVEAFMAAVWPTLWPVVAMTPIVIVLRAVLPARLISVAVTSAIGALGYAVTFLAFAVEKHERRAYIEKASELARWRRGREAVPA